MALIDKLKAIGDAIRSKLGTTQTYTLAEMPAAILSIQTGSGGTGGSLTDFLQGTATELVDNEAIWINPYKFHYDKTLTKVSGEKIESIGDHAFYYVETLTEINMPSLRDVSDSGLYRTSITSITAPNMITVGVNAFCGCKLLTKADFGKYQSRITEITFADSAMQTCKLLDTVILRYKKVGYITGHPFWNTPIEPSDGSAPTGYIYVPAELLSSYQNNWGVYAARFRAIEDYPDICG